MAEDWLRSASNKFDVETQNRHDIEKALGVVNHEKTQLAEKLKAVERARQNAESRLKNAKAQAEDQCKELYAT